MLDLQEMRKEIDVIDDQIVKLFEKRMSIAEHVAKFKIENNKPVFDRNREEEKLEALGNKTHSAFNCCGIQELYQHIMSISRKRQYQLLQEHEQADTGEFQMVDALRKKDVTVVFQGVEGAYSHAAMNSCFFGEEIFSYHVDTWKDAMEEIKKGNAMYAVLPIENSTAGIVQDNYDLLTEYNHVIAGEQIIQCRHMLLGISGTELEDIKRVYSHPQALMQCREFLDSHKEWQCHEFGNTAAAAKKVSEEQDKTQAAIASPYAAEYFGLIPLAAAYLHQSGQFHWFYYCNKGKNLLQGRKENQCQL